MDGIVTQMPGILGIISRLPRAHCEAQLRCMLESIRHEPTYQAGTWTDEALGVYAGWMLRDDAGAAELPLRNESGDRALVFSGEDFRDRAIGDQLRRKGHELSENRYSYLVHESEEDPKFPAGLNGQFQGLMADRRAKTVTLFNDRFGSHRIYYHQAKDAFYFACEIKAILAVCPEPQSADLRGLGEMIALGCVLEDRTVFPGIHVLPSASAWRFRDAGLEKHRYFSPEEWESQSVLEPEPFFEEVKAVFARDLPRFFKGPGRIGLSLTGGLDTRLMLACLHPQPGTLPCYTFGGMYRESRDVTIARRVAALCGQKHQVVPVGSEFLGRFAHYAERTVYLTDGCTGVNQAPDLYINELARQIAPVRMTGNYGDQILRHLRAFKPRISTPELYSPELLAHAEAASKTYDAIAQTHALTFAAFRQMPWHYFGLLALESSQVTMRTPYIDQDLIRLLYRAPASALENNELRVRLIGDGNQELARIRSDVGFAGRGSKLGQELSRRLYDFTIRAEYAFDYGMPQRIAAIDHRLSQFHLERFFLGRHQFTHFRTWYRAELSNYVREMLLDSRTLSRPYLCRSAVERIVAGHLAGMRNYTLEIHKLLTLEYMHRLFFDGRNNAEVLPGGAAPDHSLIPRR